MDYLTFTTVHNFYLLAFQSHVKRGRKGRLKGKNAGALPSSKKLSAKILSCIRGQDFYLCQPVCIGAIKGCCKII